MTTYGCMAICCLLFVFELCLGLFVFAGRAQRAERTWLRVSCSFPRIDFFEFACVFAERA